MIPKPKPKKAECECSNIDLHQLLLEVIELEKDMYRMRAKQARCLASAHIQIDQVVREAVYKNYFTYDHRMHNHCQALRELQVKINSLIECSSSSEMSV